MPARADIASFENDQGNFRVSSEPVTTDDVSLLNSDHAASPAKQQSVADQRVVYRGDYWLHAVFLVVATMIIALSFSMSREGPKKVVLPGFSSPMPETCTSRRLFGIECPGCGMTRAFIAISHGQLMDAWILNPASFVVYPFIAIQIPWHAIQLWRLRSGRRTMQPGWIYLIPILLGAALMVNWFFRILQQFN